MRTLGSRSRSPALGSRSGLFTRQRRVHEPHEPGRCRWRRRSSTSKPSSSSSGPQPSTRERPGLLQPGHRAHGDAQVRARQGRPDARDRGGARERGLPGEARHRVDRAQGLDRRQEGAREDRRARADAVQGLLQACSGIEELDDQQSALQRYTEASRRARASCRPTTRSGALYADLGYLDHAVQVSQSALKVAQAGSEEAAKIHNLLGTIYQQQQKFDLATQEFRAALEIVPGMRDAIFSLGWTYALQGTRRRPSATSRSSWRSLATLPSTTRRPLATSSPRCPKASESARGMGSRVEREFFALCGG